MIAETWLKHLIQIRNVLLSVRLNKFKFIMYDLFQAWISFIDLPIQLCNEKNINLDLIVDGDHSRTKIQSYRIHRTHTDKSKSFCFGKYMKRTTTALLESHTWRQLQGTQYGFWCFVHGYLLWHGYPKSH